MPSNRSLEPWEDIQLFFILKSFSFQPCSWFEWKYFHNEWDCIWLRDYRVSDTFVYRSEAWMHFSIAGIERLHPSALPGVVNKEHQSRQSRLFHLANWKQPEPLLTDTLQKLPKPLRFLRLPSKEQGSEKGRNTVNTVCIVGRTPKADHHQSFKLSKSIWLFCNLRTNHHVSHGRADWSKARSWLRCLSLVRSALIQARSQQW